MAEDTSCRTLKRPSKDTAVFIMRANCQATFGAGSSGKNTEIPLSQMARMLAGKSLLGKRKAEGLRAHWADVYIPPALLGSWQHFSPVSGPTVLWPLI